MLNTSQMAAKLGVSVKTFRASVKSKQIPHIVVGKRRRFDPVTVEAYLTCVESQAATVAAFKPRVRNIKPSGRFAEVLGLN